MAIPLGPLETPTTPQESNGSEPRLLNLRWVPDAIYNPPPEPPVLIEGLIRRGELAVFGAARGVGKSWMGMNLATVLSWGHGTFLGTLPVACQASTLYNQGELDEWTSYRRWQRLTGGEAPPEKVAETFDRWRLRVVSHRQQTSQRTDGVSMVDSDEFIDAVIDGRVEATIAKHHFDVLLIDPWATYYAGKENSNDEVEAALDKLRDIALRYQTAIVIFAHFGKSDDMRDPEDLWRGASRLADWASTRVSLLPHYSAKDAKEQGMTRQQARRFVDVKFLRRSEPIEDFSIRWDPHTGWWDRWISAEEAGSAVAEERRAEVSSDQAAAACRAAGGAWTSISAAGKTLGIKNISAVKRILDTAVRDRLLEPFKGAANAQGYRIPVDPFAKDF